MVCGNVALEHACWFCFLGGGVGGCPDVNKSLPVGYGGDILLGKEVACFLLFLF